MLPLWSSLAQDTLTFLSCMGLVYGTLVPLKCKEDCDACFIACMVLSEVNFLRAWPLEKSGEVGEECYILAGATGKATQFATRMALKVLFFHTVAIAVVYVVRNHPVCSFGLHQHVTLGTTLYPNGLSVTWQRSYFYAAAPLLARLEWPTSCCTLKSLQLEGCSVVTAGVRQQCQHSLELVALSCS